MADKDAKPTEDQVPDHTPIQSPAPAGYRPGDDPVEVQREAARTRRAERAEADEDDAPKREAPKRDAPRK